ncbi:unnamed protein product [Ceratitis capitata]|uniref:(Mediterranean fruit fly) hypothetical protein n=1 Tax=Ceratitis capitata TaxID=7213 RepID=A0A811UW43_CERCA|nr:unnamed protein product [Ceratitis capitata]
MSRRIFTFFLKSKDEVFENFVTFKNMVERQTGQKIKALRSDNGREYINKRFDDFLKQHGIARQLTIPYSPQQNGVAERANRTLVEMARSLLVHSNMPEFLWAEAVQSACYIRNRAPTSALVGMTPYEAWSGRKPNVKNMRTFGSVAIGLDKTRKGKFHAKGKEYRFVGYSLVSKAYRLYDEERHQIVEKRDVLFDEQVSVLEPDDQIAFDLPADGATNDYRLEVGKLIPCKSEVEKEKVTCSEDMQSDEYASAEEQEAEQKQDVKVGRGRPKYVRSGMPGRPKKKYNVIQAVQSAEKQLPQTYKEAISSEHVSYWQAAMEAEYDALVANSTWTVTDLPKGEQAIGCKWVYTVKRDKTGSVERYKARLVAKGCAQRFGVNYTETFSPVCRYETIRLVLALSVQLKLYLHQMDVCTAYLNSELKDVVYMKQPEGYADRASSGKVLRLNKAIYGLKQAGREWNSMLNGALCEIGFSQCQNEPCLYKQDIKGSLCLILIYVDDLLIACQKKSDLMQVKSMISTKFECVDKGPLQMFLGMQIQRDGEIGDISMNQSLYISDMLQRHDMQQCRTATTPLDTGYQIVCERESCVKVDTKEYQSAIGELMWLALTSRPDIYHSVVKLAQRNNNPHSEHFTGVKHVMRYLAATRDLKLNYRASGQALEGFVDADWGGDISNSRSYTGYIFFLAGGPISWKSEKQSSVALSSTEAEYMALTSAAKEALHLRRLIIEIGCGNADTPTTLYGDNLSSQNLAKNPIYHARSKHIDIRHHFVREAIQSGDVELKYIPTEEMIADVLTKNLSKNKHLHFVKLMNLI